MNPDHRFVMAVDIGQARDYTAVTILHSHVEVDRVGPWPDDVDAHRRHDLVHLERFREMSYPEQVRRIAERYAELEHHAGRVPGDVTCRLVVDATGVGKPILDTFREAGLNPLGIIITSGDTATRANGVERVPKRELVTSLQVALQAGRLRIARELELAETLLREFRGFRVKITLAGHARFGNDVGQWREADHDDLVLATSLGVWISENRRRMSLSAAQRATGLSRYA